jgi:hypothetical protein
LVVSSHIFTQLPNWKHHSEGFSNEGMPKQAKAQKLRGREVQRDDYRPHGGKK